MASFHRFQRVRIVRCDAYPQFVGQECVLTEPGDVLIANRHIPGWATDLRHPSPFVRASGLPFGVLESQIEPLKYLPDAYDLEVQAIENAPNSPVPVAA